MAKGRREAAERDHVDEDTAALLQEDRQDGMGIVHMADQVGADNLPVRLDQRLLETADSADTDIADPDIDAAKGICLFGKGVDGCGIGNIGHDRYRLAARPAKPSRASSQKARRSWKNSRDRLPSTRD